MDEVVHRAGMIGMPPVHLQQQVGRPIRLLPRRAGRGARRQDRQRQPGGRLVVLGKGGVHPFHRLLPAADPLHVLEGIGLPEERRGGVHEEPLPLGGEAEPATLADLLAAAADVGGARPSGPERLEQRHGDAPPGHRATLVQHHRLLEPDSRFGVGHVVQQRHRVIERVLGYLRAGDLEVDVAQLLCLRARRRTDTGDDEQETARHARRRPCFVMAPPGGPTILALRRRRTLARHSSRPPSRRREKNSRISRRIRGNTSARKRDWGSP